MSPGPRDATAVPAETYPFENHWLERDGVRLHYLDRGSGTPILLLHGNPTWSFLYRNVIRELDGACRCIAPDYPGFGRSTAPQDYGFTPVEHAATVGRLVDALGLEGFVVVGQDWGGPVGLSVALERRERVAGVVLCNTWCWPPDAPIWLFSLLVGGPPGRWLCLRHELFTRWIVPAGIHRRERRTGTVLDAYRAPFPTRESRLPTWVFPRALRSCSGWLAGLDARLHGLQDVPVELVWGRRDPLLGRASVLERWRRRFPGAGVDRVEDAAHYLQEDRPERLAAGVRRVLERI
jgi:haloalkane dehalogenase